MPDPLPVLNDPAPVSRVGDEEPPLPRSAPALLLLGAGGLLAWAGPRHGLPGVLLHPLGYTVGLEGARGLLRWFRSRVDPAGLAEDDAREAAREAAGTDWSLVAVRWTWLGAAASAVVFLVCASPATGDEPMSPWGLAGVGLFVAGSVALAVWTTVWRRTRRRVDPDGAADG